MVMRTAILFVSDEVVAVETVATPLVQRLRQLLSNGVFMIHQQVAASQRHWIEEILRRWCDEDEIDLILTVGGTFPAPGPSEAEIVPEATAAVIERLTPSLPELMRRHALTVNASAVLDRGISGIRGRTLIVNLPMPLELATLFLDAGADAIEKVLFCLQPASAEDGVEPAVSKRPVHKLDEAEFAEFLRKRGKSQLR